MNPFFLFIFSISTAWTKVRVSSVEIAMNLAILAVNGLYLAMLAGITGFGLYKIMKLIRKTFSKKLPTPDANDQEKPESDDVTAAPESTTKPDAPESHSYEVKPFESPKTTSDSESQTDSEAQKTSVTLGTQTEIQKLSTSTQTSTPTINFTEIDLYVLYTKFCPHHKDNVIFVMNNVSMDQEKILFNAEEFRFERVQCGCEFEESEVLPANEAKTLFEKDSLAYGQKMRIDRSEDGFLEKRILVKTILKERVAGSGILQRWVQIRKEEPIVDRVADSEAPEASTDSEASTEDSEEDSGDSDDSRYFEPDTASESDSEDPLPVFDEPPPPPFDLNDLNNLSLHRELRESEDNDYVKLDESQEVLAFGSDDSDDEEDPEGHVETEDPENPGFFEIKL